MSIMTSEKIYRETGICPICHNSKGMYEQIKKLQKQSDMLTLGILQEKNKVAALEKNRPIKNLQWLDCAYYGTCKLKKAIEVCRDINDSGEEYASPNADAAQALANLFSLVDIPKFCICCEEITEENAHLHRNCGK